MGVFSIDIAEVGNVETNEVVKNNRLYMLSIKEKVIKGISKEKLTNSVKVLSEEIGVRLTGSQKGIEAAYFIYNTLESYGYVVEMQGFPILSDTYSYNVIARKSEDLEKTQRIVIGAHYDSVKNSPGAMDNATGVSAVLEISRILHDYDTKCSLEFVLFGAEECFEGSCKMSLQGSQYYVSTYENKEFLYGMINLDMIGDNEAIQLRRDKKLSSDFTSYLVDASEYRNVTIRIKQSSDWSDHDSFEEDSIPAVFIYVPSESFNHTPQDTISNVSFDTIKEITELVAWSLINNYSCKDK